MSRLSSVPQRVLAAVPEFHDVASAMLANPHDPQIARAVAARLCRRHTDATLSELAIRLARSFPNR
jgi:hypothetical protein